MDDDDLRVCGKIFCQGEEVHLISRFEEDQILEIGSALFMIFSFFKTIIFHSFINCVTKALSFKVVSESGIGNT